MCDESASTQKICLCAGIGADTFEPLLSWRFIIIYVQEFLQFVK